MPDRKTPVQAIREYCLSCCLESSLEVKLCVSESCPLYPFRFGKNPNMTRTVSDEERESLLKRLSDSKSE